MSISPQDLQRLNRAAKSPPTLIESDQKCVQCGYSLRGLKTDGKCPECGRPITPRRKLPVFADQMTAAPVAWLRGFVLGTLLLAIGATLVLLSAIVYAFSNNEPNIMIGVAIGGAVLYVGAVMVTRPRPVTPATTSPPDQEWYWSRTLGRFSQGGWSLGAGLALASSHTSTGAMVFEIMGLAAFAMAILGIAPLMSVLSNLAYWASDTSLSNRLRIASLVTPFGAFVALAIIGGGAGGAFGGLIPPVFLLLVSASVLAAFGGVILPVGIGLLALWQLWWMARWVVINHMAAKHREARAKEKFERERARAGMKS